MSDSITQSIWTGFNMAHTVDQERRMKEAAQLQRVLQTLQVNALLQKQAQEQANYPMVQEGNILDLLKKRAELQKLQNPEKADYTMGNTRFEGATNKPLATVQTEPPKQEPFTLSPGQIRYDPTGKPIASGGPKEEPELKLDNYTELALSSSIPGFLNDPAIRKQALTRFATEPKFNKDILDKAATIAQGRAAPIYNVMPGYQMPNGQPAIANVRTGNITPAGGPEVQKTPSESDVATARTKTTIDSVIDEIDSAFKKAEKSLPKDAQDRVIGAPARIAKVKTQSDPDLVLADSLATGFLAKFARAAGEVGVLTDRDIERAKPLTYSIHDTPDVRNKKRDAIKNLFNEIYERGKRQENPLGNMQDSSIKTADDYLKKIRGK